ncbi:hypothetical protein BHE74_00012139 [Ensete ventricosum]|nr:hypothetical protein BHE74_00012139 [Ensete ventricosum]
MNFLQWVQRPHPPAIAISPPLTRASHVHHRAHPIAEASLQSFPARTFCFILLPGVEQVGDWRSLSCLQSR